MTLEQSWLIARLENELAEARATIARMDAERRRERALFFDLLETMVAWRGAALEARGVEPEEFGDAAEYWKERIGHDSALHER